MEEFKQFLIAHNSLEEYVVRFKAFTGTSITYGWEQYIQYQNFLSGSFPWESRTPSWVTIAEELNWRELDRLWRIQVCKKDFHVTRQELFDFLSMTETFEQKALKFARSFYDPKNGL